MLNRDIKNNHVGQTKKDKKRDLYLGIETIQKMLDRFLTETQMSREMLTEALGISVRELKSICSSRASLSLMCRVNLPLIKLYCKTKFGK